jgi:hypothetical protein
MFEFSITGTVKSPAHIVCERTAFVTEGRGLTVTTILPGVPEQNVGAGPVGVITYVTCPVVVAPNGRSRMSLIGPEPLAVNPVTVPMVSDAVQVKVEPETLATGVYATLFPVHIVEDNGLVMTGCWFTVIVTGADDPGVHGGEIAILMNKVVSNNGPGA